MKRFRRLLEQKRLAPTLALIAVVLLATWMGGVNGGFFTGDWAPVVFILATLILVASVTGVLRGGRSWWSVAATGLLAAYTIWTFLSLLWSPNQGDAWLGAGQTLLYLLAFWVTVSLVALGASRRWVLAASVIGPAVVAALTLQTLSSRIEVLFEDNRLMGTVGYYNGEAAFLLVPFWAALYLAGSRGVNPVLRSAVLAGAVLSVEVAVLTQSRGAMVALFVSFPIFFLLSGQRLRGLLALVPMAVALLVAFPALNEVYLELSEGGSPDVALDGVFPTVWLTAGGAGLYGLFWGLLDRRWSPPVGIVRTVRGIALVGSVAVLVVGGFAVNERVGSPIAWSQQKWEAFKANDVAGQEQSRYLSASGSGRYTYWQVVWDDFASHPVLGVGTHNYEATYYQKREQANGYVRQPHMLPLEVLAERGVVGGVLFCGFVATCLTAGLWNRLRQLSTEGRAQVGALVASTTYWLVHSSAEWFWQMPAVTLPAVIYLALLAGPWQRAEAAPLRWPLRAVGAGAALLAVAAVAPLYAANHYLTQSYATENPWVALEAVERAQTFNPIDPQLRQREAELAIQIGNWPRVVDAYGEATRLNPEHYAPHLLLARFYEQMGEPEEALSSYREALALNPLEEEINQAVDRLEAEVEVR